MPRHVSQRSSRNRDYDHESGMDRVRKPNSKKVRYVEEEEESFSSESEDQVRIAKKKILKKDWKEDARRPRTRAPSPVNSSHEDDTPGTSRTTKQSGTADSTSAASASTPVAPHLVLLSVTDKVGFVRPVHHALNSFTVNFSVLFTLLNGLEISLYGNTRINNYFGEYFSLGPRIYYAYLGYYQILRAKLAASVPLDAVERRVYRKLETTLPLESCPVAGCLVGWFEALGSYRPDDKIYNWVYPTTQVFEPDHTLWSSSTSAFWYPPIPHMVAAFRSFANIPSGQYSQFVNASGFLVPVRNVAFGAVSWLGRQWELDQTTASPADLIRTFCRPGLSFAFPEQTNLINGARCSAWKRIGVPNPSEKDIYDDLEKYLLCEGSENLNWLRTFRNWANAQARFCKGSVNLSQISPVTGPSVLCTTEYTNRSEQATMLTEPWITPCNDYYFDREFTTQTASSSVEDMDMTRAHTYRLIIEVSGTGRCFPAPFGRHHSIIIGPLFRQIADDGTYTGPQRDRWKKEMTPESLMDSDLRDIINMHLYSPMGEDPEPVRLT